MKEQIKKWAILIIECFVLGFAVSAGMCLCTLLFTLFDVLLGG